MKRFFLSMFLMFFGPALAAPPLTETPAKVRAEIERGCAELWKPAAVCRKGMDRVTAYVAQGPFAAKTLLTSDQRAGLKGTWKVFFDYVCAMDRIGFDFRLTSENAEIQLQEEEFDRLAYAVFVSQYRSALEFLKALDGIPGVDTLLNEAMPESGIPAGSLKAFKFRFLNVAQATQFAAFQVADRALSQRNSPWMRQASEDEKALWALGVGKGSGMTVENGMKLIGRNVFEAWFPTQKGVAQWMGEMKVWREGRTLITEDQEKLLTRKLRPGDILFSRHEWYLSNLGLPGFWSHAALYIGTAEERAATFNDPAVREWAKKQGAAGGFEDLLKARFPKAHANALAADGEGHHPRVLEAVGAGVVFSPMEKFAKSDSLSVLRPRLSKVEKARAILRAFGYAGRPYDFDFDFRSDAALVCSELVYKAYEPAKGYRGMKFPLQVMTGHVVSSPNGMVQQFAEQYGTKEQQSDLVVFLDGHEKENKAYKTGVTVFRKSWQRPKWNVFLQ